MIYLSQETTSKYSLPSSMVSIQALQALVNFQAERDWKIQPRLTQRNITPGNFEKMKVNLASDLLSRETGAAIRILVEHYNFDLSFITTAWFCEQVGKWFDIMTSQSLGLALSKTNGDTYQSTLAFLTEFQSIIEDCAIRQESIGSDGPPQINATCKPVQRGILLSIHSFMDVAEFLLSEAGFAFVFGSRLTQNCIENVFSAVRYKNATPTPMEFKNALKIISLSQFFYSKRMSSYENDGTSFLASLNEMKSLMPANEDGEDPVTFEEPPDGIDDLESLDFADLNSLIYFGGYCLFKTFTKIRHCESCYNYFVNQEARPATCLVKLRNYTENNLICCSKEAESVFRMLEHTFCKYSPQICNMKDVAGVMVADAHRSIMTLPLTLPTCHDMITAISSQFIRCRVHFHLRQRTTQLKELQKKKLQGSAEASRSMAMRKKVK